MSSRKRFLCSYNRIEIIISYLCNLRCINCDAMVSQAPSKDSMSVEQIQKFVQESIEKKIFWKHIRILGGEPTLHKDLLIFLDLLRNYRDQHSPETKIQLVTNGYAPISRKVIAQLPADIEVENSNKTGSFQPQFALINNAPVDSEEHRGGDFSKGCWIPSLCGIALDMHGYYPCSAAAAFDRVAGFDLGKKEMPRYGDLEKLFNSFCRMCGHFADKINLYAKEDITTEAQKDEFEVIHKEHFPESYKDNNFSETVYSPTWQKIMDKYRAKKPVLSRY